MVRLLWYPEEIRKDNHLDPLEHIVEHADGLELPLGDEQHALLGGDAVRDLLLLRAGLLQLPAPLLNCWISFHYQAVFKIHI